MIKIRDYELDIDVLEELDPYDWYRGRVRVQEFTACSPFRNESSPSFSINLETGLWIDFGAGIEEYYKKGDIVLLLSYLRAEDNRSVEDYLIEKYGIDLGDTEKLQLGLNLTLEEVTPFTMSLDEYKQYAFRHPYLGGRGITETVQKAFKVGYDTKRKAIALPWMDIYGKIINVKFRSVNSKMFFYLPDGQQLRNHIYGMNFVYKLGCETVYVCESEIDCLYLWSHGKPAIALGGSNMSAKQRQLILRSPITQLVIATDNDLAGEKIKDKIVGNLNGLIKLSEIELPVGVKDVNDLAPNRLLPVLENHIPIPLYKAVT
jgi:DNA primase